MEAGFSKEWLVGDVQLLAGFRPERIVLVPRHSSVQSTAYIEGWMGQPLRSGFGQGHFIGVMRGFDSCVILSLSHSTALRQQADEALFFYL